MSLHVTSYFPTMRTDECKYICYFDVAGVGHENYNYVGQKLAVTLALYCALPLHWLEDRAHMSAS